ILSYYNFADPKKARALKTDIQKITDGLRKKLNNRLDQFIEAEWKVRPKKKIDFVDLTKDSAAKKTWDAYRLKADAHSAFHWVMEFSNILLPEGKPGGGFDVVLLNPPWEILKPNSQEFFEKEVAGFRDLDKNKARKAVEKAFEKQKQLKKEWMEHSLSMSAVLEYYRVCGDYPARGDGAVNLYKLFLERAFSLLKEGGSLGIVMPSGFYSDLGCKDLRALFFEKSAVHFLYGFENRKLIFEDVDSRFKFILLSASKESEEPGISVPSAFMMHTEGDLESAHAHAPASRFLDLPQTLIRKLAPDTLTIMEFRSPLDIQITSKMARFPALDDHFGFHREFNSTDDAHLMIDLGSLKERKELLEHGHVGHKSKYLAVVYEGKNIWHFTADLADPTKACVLDQIESGYKIAYRRISRSTDRRTLMATLLPAAVRSVDSINVSASVLNAGPLLAIMSCLNSYAPDFFIRMVTNANIHVSVLAPLPVPRFQSPDDHPYFQPLVEKAARLVGTTAAYDDLLREVFGKKADHKTHGVTDPAARQKLKNEIDAMVAKIYDLTEDELTHVLSTFPLVEDEIKQGVLNIYRSLEGSRPPGGRPDEAP
ncbi:MAG: restriction endonuclease subunit M, partial [Spirochaetia bacterium]|nr:restriction endonuclease subunit M [Spirochaetia bacterium]